MAIKPEDVQIQDFCLFEEPRFASDVGHNLHQVRIPGQIWIWLHQKISKRKHEWLQLPYFTILQYFPWTCWAMPPWVCLKPWFLRSDFCPKKSGPWPALMFGASNGKFCGSVLSGRNDSVISTGPKLKVQLPESWARFPPSKSCEYRCMDSWFFWH